MNYNHPKQIIAIFSESGLLKHRLPITRFMVLSFLGGAFIAFGALLTVVVAGGLPTVAIENPGLVKLMAGMLFPVGLIMVSVAGADLFTSNAAALTLPWLNKELSWQGVLKIGLFSYLLNFVGTQFVAYFLAQEVGLLAVSPWKEYAYQLAEFKLSHSFSTTFIKGVGANWLVCLGVWMGYAAKDVAGKAIGIWVPVMLFVTLGYEHSIANMFFIPAAIYSGADISWPAFLQLNLLPATLGNVVGGAVFVAMAYWFVYQKKTKKAG